MLVYLNIRWSCEKSAFREPMVGFEPTVRKSILITSQAESTTVTHRH